EEEHVREEERKREVRQEAEQRRLKAEKQDDVRLTASKMKPKAILLATLVTTVGWGITFILAVRIWKEANFAIMWIFIGVSGGFVNAFTLRWMKPSMTPRNVFYLITGWVIPFLCTWPLLWLWPAAWVIWLWPAAWVISSLVTALVLRKKKSSIEWTQI